MATVEIENKFCKKCKSNLWYFNKLKNTATQCYNCMKESCKKHNASDKGKVSLEKARKKERDNLTDNYIRQTLATRLYIYNKCKLDRSSIPDDIIEKVRQSILSKRQLKLIKNENKKKIK
jgi:hypothetical protein